MAECQRIKVSSEISMGYKLDLHSITAKSCIQAVSCLYIASLLYLKWNFFFQFVNKRLSERPYVLLLFNTLVFLSYTSLSWARLMHLALHFNVSIFIQPSCICVSSKNHDNIIEAVVHLCLHQNLYCFVGQSWSKCHYCTL